MSTEYTIDWEDAALQYEECGLEVYNTKGYIDDDDDEAFDSWDSVITH